MRTCIKDDDLLMMAGTGMALAGALPRDGVRMLGAGGGVDRGGAAAARGANRGAAGDHANPGTFPPGECIDKHDERNQFNNCFSLKTP